MTEHGGEPTTGVLAAFGPVEQQDQFMSKVVET